MKNIENGSHSRVKVDPKTTRERILFGKTYNRLTSHEKSIYEQGIGASHDDMIIWARIAKRFGDDPVRLDKILQLALPFSIIERISSTANYSDEDVDAFLSRLALDEVSVRNCHQILHEMKFDGVIQQEPLIREEEVFDVLTDLRGREVSKDLLLEYLQMVVRHSQEMSQLIGKWFDEEMAG